MPKPDWPREIDWEDEPDFGIVRDFDPDTHRGAEEGEDDDGDD